MEENENPIEAVDEALSNVPSGTEEGDADDDLELDIPLEGDEETPDGEGDSEEGEEDNEEDSDDTGVETRGENRTNKGKKEPDAINDPIPKDLKQATSDRIRKLIDTTRELTQERDTIRTEYDTIINGIRQTGATPEQYGEALSWISLFNSPNVEARRQAYQLVENVAAQLALQLGIERNVADPLSKYPDLLQAVQQRQVTPVLARELARQREQQQFQGQLNQQASQQRQTQAQQQQELAQGRQSLNQLEAELKQTDPLYDRKRAQLVPLLQPVFKNLRPSQWAAAFREAYKNVRVQREAPTTRALPRGNGMRPKNPSGGQVRQPTSAMDAINSALSGLGR